MDFPTNIITAATVPLSALLGGKTGYLIAETVTPLPVWFSSLLGPAGALVGMILAIRWLIARLDKQELKADARDAERAVNIATMTHITTQNQAIIEQNSDMLRDAKFAIEKCTQCEIKHILGKTK